MSHATDSALASDETLAPHVLFATRVPDRSSVALLRAVAFARTLGARLSIVHVIPPQQTTSTALFPQRGAQQIAGTFATGREVEKSRGWSQRLAPGAELVVREGGFEQTIIDLGATRRPELVVVAAANVTRARDAMWMAHEIGCPVLLARTAKVSSTIVAATDLRSADAPVVRAAADLASRLQAELVVVHNVPSLVVAPLASTGNPLPLSPTADEVSARARLLEQTVRAVQVRAEAVVMSEPHTAEAVLSEARARAADIIAVGTYGTGWLERIFFGSTAEEVLDRSRRSVLVLPLDRKRGALATPHAPFVGAPAVAAPPPTS